MLTFRVYFLVHFAVQHKEEGRTGRSGTARRTEPAHAEKEDTRRVGCRSGTGGPGRLYE